MKKATNAMFFATGECDIDMTAKSISAIKNAVTIFNRYFDFI